MTNFKKYLSNKSLIAREVWKSEDGSRLVALVSGFVLASDFEYCRYLPIESAHQVEVSTKGFYLK